MKNALRTCAFLLVTVLLCVTLCGCDTLDEARANHAFWAEGGHIRLGDVEYIPLPYSEYLKPIFSSERTVYATDPDVPVLLSSLFGTAFDISRDEVILADYWETGNYYCRADKYEELLRRMQEGFTPTGYGYIYYDYETSEEYYYTLTADQATAVETVYRTASGESLPDMAELYFDYYVSLEQHSDDLLFRRAFIELNVADGRYYLVEYTDEDTLVYEVPAEYNATFAAIMASVIEAESYWEDLFDYEYDEEYFEEDFEESLFGA